MWSSWVKRKGTTQIMYIAKLKDGWKRAKKTFSMILERVFEMVWSRGRTWNHIKRDIFEVEVFFSSQNIDFPFIWKDSWCFSFSSSFSFFFSTIFLSLLFYALSLEDLGVFDDIWGEKSLLQKLSFQMEWHSHDCGYTGGGRIFQNGVMHANIAKPWLWRCGSCGYIGGGCIFRSGGMHDNISGWG
jgi:hypothetical protein